MGTGGALPPRLADGLGAWRWLRTVLLPQLCSMRDMRQDARSISPPIAGPGVPGTGPGVPGTGSTIQDSGGSARGGSGRRAGGWMDHLSLAVQSAGDTVFVPAGWYHLVVNLEMTVAVQGQVILDGGRAALICEEYAPAFARKLRELGSAPSRRLEGIAIGSQ